MLAARLRATMRVGQTLASASCSTSSVSSVTAAPAALFSSQVARRGSKLRRAPPKKDVRIAFSAPKTPYVPSRAQLIPSTDPLSAAVAATMTPRRAVMHWYMSPVAGIVNVPTSVPEAVRALVADAALQGEVWRSSARRMLADLAVNGAASDGDAGPDFSSYVVNSSSNTTNTSEDEDASISAGEDAAENDDDFDLSFSASTGSLAPPTALRGRLPPLVEPAWQRDPFVYLPVTAKEVAAVTRPQLAVCAFAFAQVPPLRSHIRDCEIVFAGRSNVGKSALINALLGTDLAMSSSIPGKTQSANFYLLPAAALAAHAGRYRALARATPIDLFRESSFMQLTRHGMDTQGSPTQVRSITDAFSSLGGSPGLLIVDVPGYGFAKAARGKVDHWNQLIGTYLRARSPTRFFVDDNAADPAASAPSAAPLPLPARAAPRTIATVNTTLARTLAGFHARFTAPPTVTPDSSAGRSVGGRTSVPGSLHPSRLLPGRAYQPTRVGELAAAPAHWQALSSPSDVTGPAAGAGAGNAEDDTEAACARVLSRLRGMSARFAPPLLTARAHGSNLRMAVVLVDARAGVTPQDAEFLDFLEVAQIPHQVVLTKVDRLSGRELERAVQAVSQALFPLEFVKAKRAFRHLRHEEVISGADGGDGEDGGERRAIPRSADEGRSGGRELDNLSPLAKEALITEARRRARKLAKLHADSDAAHRHLVGKPNKKPGFSGFAAASAAGAGGRGAAESIAATSRRSAGAQGERSVYAHHWGLKVAGKGERAMGEDDVDWESVEVDYYGIEQAVDGALASSDAIGEDGDRIDLSRGVSVSPGPILYESRVRVAEEARERLATAAAKAAAKGNAAAAESADGYETDTAGHGYYSDTEVSATSGTRTGAASAPNAGRYEINPAAAVDFFDPAVTSLVSTDPAAAADRGNALTASTTATPVQSSSAPSTKDEGKGKGKGKSDTGPAAAAAAAAAPDVSTLAAADDEAELALDLAALVSDTFDGRGRVATPRRFCSPLLIGVSAHKKIGLETLKKAILAAAIA